MHDIQYSSPQPGGVSQGVKSVAPKSQPPNTIRTQYQAEREGRDDDLAERTHDERSQSLPGHFAKVRAQANTGKGQQERPAREVAQRGHLILAESVETDEQGDCQKSQHELGKLVPQKG